MLIVSLMNPCHKREWHIFSFQIIADILNHISCMQYFKYFNYRIENNHCWKVTPNWCWKFSKIVTRFGAIVARFGDAGSMFWFVKNGGTILKKSWRNLTKYNFVLSTKQWIVVRSGQIVARFSRDLITIYALFDQFDGQSHETKEGNF